MSNLGDEAAVRDVHTLVVPEVGAVVVTDVAPAGVAVRGRGRCPGSRKFASSCARCWLAGRVCRVNCVAYATAGVCLRWWRFLAAIEVSWDRAGRADVRDFVLVDAVRGPAAVRDLGETRRRLRPRDDQPQSRGPEGLLRRPDREPVSVLLVNPVPAAEHRVRVGESAAHHNPMEPHDAGRRAPLRQSMPDRVPRALPDRLFDALFAVAGCDRDRALLAFYVSTGARASELLGVTLDLVDPGTQRIAVRRKGSERLQWLPASTDAFVWLRLYQQHQLRPAGERAFWLTRRTPHGPLTYSATRRMLQRANAALGTRWTLHDLRHTAAQRMIDDPRAVAERRAVGPGARTPDARRRSTCVRGRTRL